MTTSRHSAWKRRGSIGAVWLTIVLPGLLSVLVEQPYPTPAVSDWERLEPSGHVYSLDAGPAEVQEASNPGLIGYWEHRSRQGTVTLEVVSDDRIIVSGHPMKYQILPGILRLADNEGAFDYPCRLHDDRLILTITDSENVPRDIRFRLVDLTGPETGF